MLYVIVYTIAETSKKSNMEKQNNVSGQAFAFPDVFFTRELNVDNEINESMLVSLKREINFLNSVNNDRITIFIGSLGGYFDPAKEMFEMFLGSPSEIIGVAGKKISSLAAMLAFQGCHLRLIRRETEMMLHKITQFTTFRFVPFETDRQKSHLVLEKEFNVATNKQRYINTILSHISGKSENYIIELLKEKRVLSPKEIIRLKFADGFYPDDLP